MADIYDSKDGSCIASRTGYSRELAECDGRIRAIFKEFVGYGYRPSDVALFLMEEVSGVRMEYALSERFKEAK
jgi:hypothetical protein